MGIINLFKRTGKKSTPCILEPCPFCGRLATIETDTFALIWYRVECSKCKASSSEFETEQEAVKAWNRRIKK